MTVNSTRSTIWNDLTNPNTLIKIIMLFSIFTIIVFLGGRWIRSIHIISGFIWWGMVFFINFIILPVFSRLSSSTQLEMLGKIFPRIFRNATVFGFFTVSLGWYYALEFYAKWSLTYFTKSFINILFLIGVTLITLLYGFHLFLERSEIKLITDIANGDVAYEDQNVQSLISHLLRIPRIGFLIQSFAVVLMFVHT